MSQWDILLGINGQRKEVDIFDLFNVLYVNCSVFGKESNLKGAKVRRLILALAMMLSSCQASYAMPIHQISNSANLVEPDWNKLADAIHLTENGHELDKGEQYGIHSMPYKDTADARRICIATCRHKYAQWARNRGRMGYLEYLSNKYCPVNHAVWLTNVRYFYEQPS